MACEGNTKKWSTAKEVPKTEAATTCLGNPTICNDNNVVFNEDEAKEERKENEYAFKIGITDPVEIAVCIERTDLDVSDNSSNKFSIDHSKRGTAKCMVCKKPIAKNELRIGKLVPFKTKQILQFYHVPCMFTSFRKAKIISNTICNTNDIDGFDKLDPD